MIQQERPRGLLFLTTVNSPECASLYEEAHSELDGLVEDSIETLNECGWVFEWNAF
jgi:hypothetical protein